MYRVDEAWHDYRDEAADRERKHAFYSGVQFALRLLKGPFITAVDQTTAIGQSDRATAQALGLLEDLEAGTDKYFAELADPMLDPHNWKGR